MDAVEPDDASNTHARRSAIFRAAHKRLDPIDGPRALGQKRSALQAQRRRRPIVEYAIGLLRTDGRGSSLLISKDGTIAFALKRSASGLLVEKRYCRSTGLRISHLMIFQSQSVFDRWCDIEPTRFDDPLLCDKLRRCAHELFASHS